MSATMPGRDYTTRPTDGRCEAMAGDPILRDFDRLAATRPEAPLVLSPGRSVSAQEIDRLSRALAGRLACLPPIADRPVVLRSPNGPGFLAAALAIPRAGGAALLLDASVPEPEERRVADAMGAAAVVRSTHPWPESHDAFEVGACERPRVDLPAGTEWIKVTSGSSGVPSGVAFTSEALAEDTGQSIEVIERDTDRDNFMSAEQAVNYGQIDKVLENREQAAA